MLRSLIISAVLCSAAFASVADNYYPVSYSCNGSDTTFTFPWRINTTADIVVTLVDASAEPNTLALTTDYTVSATNNDFSSGGTVTTVSTYASGYTIVLSRTMALTQSTAWLNQGSLTPYSVRVAMDKMTMLIQNLQEQIERSLRFPIEDYGHDANVPSATERANRYPVFDANGFWTYVGWVPNSPTFGSTVLITTGGAEIPLTIQANNDPPSDTNNPFIRTGGGGSLSVNSGVWTESGSYGQLYLNGDQNSPVILGSGTDITRRGWLGYGTLDPCYPVDIHGTARFHTIIADSNIAYGTSTPSIRVCGTDFDAEITAIGSTETHLIVGQSVTASQNVTVPRTCTVEVTRSGSISGGSYELVFNGPFVCSPAHRAFHGTDYKVGLNGNVIISPGWWGAFPDDANYVDHIGINNALVAANWANTSDSRGRIVQCEKGDYSFYGGGTVDQFRSDTILRGAGKYNTNLGGFDYTEPNASVMYLRGVNRPTISDLRISCGTGTNDRPRAIVACGRNPGAQGGEITMKDVLIDGYSREYGLMLFAQEVDYFENCTFGASPSGIGVGALYIGHTDRHAADANGFGFTGQSNTRWVFVDCDLSNYNMSDPNDCLFRFDGYGSDLLWLGGYWYASKAAGYTNVKMGSVITDSYYSGISNIRFEGVRQETTNEGRPVDYFLWDKQHATGGIHGGAGVTFTDSTLDVNQTDGYFVKADPNTNAYYTFSGLLGAPTGNYVTGTDTYGGYEVKGTSSPFIKIADNWVGQTYTMKGEYPRIQLQEYAADNMSLAFDAYKTDTGNSSQWYSSDAGSNFSIYKGGDTADTLQFGYSHGKAPGTAIGTMEKSANINLTTGVWDFNVPPTVAGGVISGYTNLTSYVAQTAWRMFYSNGSGDVTELALGAAGTILAGNGATSAPTFIAAGPTISSGVAAPATTPGKIGDIFVNTAAHKLYFADGTVSDANWVIAN